MSLRILCHIVVATIPHAAPKDFLVPITDAPSAVKADKPEPSSHVPAKHL